MCVRDFHHSKESAQFQKLRKTFTLQKFTREVIMGNKNRVTVSVGLTLNPLFHLIVPSVQNYKNTELSVVPPA